MNRLLVLARPVPAHAQLSQVALAVALIPDVDLAAGPTISEVARRARCHRKQAQKWLDWLEAAGALRRDRLPHTRGRSALVVLDREELLAVARRSVK